MRRRSHTKADLSYQGDRPATMKQSWRQHAACRGLDPMTFYSATDDEADAAKEICAQCPVREACLEHALTFREKEGVWGGCTERERRRIIRQRRRAS
jgi:WhiB family transcriptional regulator, redox-sensing transcriptional regulator